LVTFIAKILTGIADLASLGGLINWVVAFLSFKTVLILGTLYGIPKK
jgi:hypothetical protein